MPGLLPVATRNLKGGYHADRDETPEAYCGSTTASSCSPAITPDGSPKTISGKETPSLSQRRSAFRNRPSINCALVVQEQQPVDPFLHNHSSRLSEDYDGFVKLGEGSCGVVYKVRSRRDNTEVALKIMRMDDEERFSIARKEYDLLKQVSHPNIIRALDFFTYSMGAVLALDYFDGKKLTRAVREAPGRCLPESVARHLAAQLVGAISHLHLHDIIHRDVKAENILVSRDLTDLRLVDFNAAKQLVEGQALTMTGTVDYMPPESLQGDSPSQAGDVWATGLCLYLMLAGHLPSERRALRIKFDAFDKVGIQQGSLVQLDGETWNSISESCKQVVKKCLELDCDFRPLASTVLAMPWFDNVSPVDGA
jgi:serine/threonine protein kinase